MKKIVRLEVVFENCEVYEGNVPDIKLRVKGLHLKDVLSNPEQKTIRLDADSITLRIKPYLNDLRNRILQEQDITWVYAIFEDGQEIAFCAPWNGDDESNTYQHHFFDEETLVIQIAKPVAEKGVSRLEKYTCPYCHKDYDDVDAFADCVAKCKQKKLRDQEKQRQEENKKKKEAAKEMQKAELTEVNEAYRAFLRLKQTYEDKYHTVLVSNQPLRSLFPGFPL